LFIFIKSTVILKNNMKRKYSWNDIHRLTIKASKTLNNKPTTVLSIAKGGLIPGIILAEAFGAKHVSIGIKSYNNQNSRENIEEYQSPDFKLLKHERVLVVDDVADSGHTFQYITKRLKQNSCLVFETLSVLYKPCSIFQPDNIGETVSSDEWVVFPWEVE
jgi:hypoxanthine phosphoribosyltransferase